MTCLAARARHGQGTRREDTAYQGGPWAWTADTQQVGCRRGRRGRYCHHLIFQPPTSTNHAKSRVPRVPRVPSAQTTRVPPSGPSVPSAPSVPSVPSARKRAIDITMQSSWLTSHRHQDHHAGSALWSLDSRHKPDLRRYSFGGATALEPKERLARSIVSCDWTEVDDGCGRAGW